MKAFRNLKLSLKLSLVCTVSVLGIALILVILVFWLSGQYNTLAQSEINKLTDSDLDHITMGVYNMVKAQDEAVQQEVSNSLNTARYVLSQTGQVSLSAETVEWSAVNQLSGESERVRIPKMLAGSQWLGQNSDLAVASPVVDEVQHLVGGTCTIFQRMNEAGDMLRVATNVATADGQRAVGTYIPAVNPDGVPNAVIAAILQGNAYRGRAYVVNDWYITAYEPIRDGDGEIIGMLYAGIKQENVTSLRQAILDTTVGKTGYVYILGGSGDQKGHYIISKDGARDGENIWGSQDADGRYFIQSIVEKAIALGPGEMATERYTWQNIGEKAARMKIARLMYYAPWDWVIGAGVYEDDLIEYRAILENGRSQMVNMMGVVSLAAAVVITLIVILIARTIANPVNRLARVAGNLAEGDLAINDGIAYQSRDEVGLLAEAFRRMTVYIEEMAAAADRLAQGDLTAEIIPRSERDALGNAFATMITSLRETIRQVAQNAAGLEMASNQLASAAGQARQATNQIAITVQQVARGAMQQSEAGTRTAASVEQMTQAIDGVAKGAQDQAASIGKVSNIAAQITVAVQQVAGNADMVTRDSAKTADAARHGAKTVQETVNDMESIKIKVGLSARKVNEMGQRSDQIGAIVETIEDIASQTNLLALNAAIEAARAGEQGKGFAVVADEVRKLSERASAATKEIGELIRGIQQIVAEAETAMNDGVQEMDRGVARASEAGQALADISKAAEAVYQQAVQAAEAAQRMSASSNELVNAMDSVSAVVEENTAATEEMAAGSSEVRQAIETIASVSEESSAATEEVSASAEEMSAQVEEVNASAQALAEMAQTLKSVVAGFVIEESPKQNKPNRESESRSWGAGSPSGSAEPKISTATLKPGNGRPVKVL